MEFTIENSALENKNLSLAKTQKLPLILKKYLAYEVNMYYK